jgi:hypothetical protein
MEPNPVVPQRGSDPMLWPEQPDNDLGITWRSRGPSALLAAPSSPPRYQCFSNLLLPSSLKRWPFTVIALTTQLTHLPPAASPLPYSFKQQPTALQSYTADSSICFARPATLYNMSHAPDTEKSLFFFRWLSWFPMGYLEGDRLIIFSPSCQRCLM